jgi:hypothetical protein
LLGEDLVYPGHPVAIALCIVRFYETYEAALYRSKDSYPSALGSRAIPSSLHAYLAVELLKKLRAGYCFELAMTWADLVWRASVEEKAVTPDPLLPAQVSEGTAQGNRAAPLLRELSSWWEE